MKRRVVITACSAISPIGYDKNEIIESLTQGRSGVSPLRDDGLLTKIAFQAIVHFATTLFRSSTLQL